MAWEFSWMAGQSKTLCGTIYNDPIETALERESFLKNDKKCDLVICFVPPGFKLPRQHGFR